MRAEILLPPRLSRWGAPFFYRMRTPYVTYGVCSIETVRGERKEPQWQL